MPATSPTFTYPKPRRDEAVVDDQHGQKIADPYRWMEDPDSEETKQFVMEENAVSTPYINACPERTKIYEALTKLKNYPKHGLPSRQGSRYYFYQNSGLQNQSVLYQEDTLEGPAKEFLDPNSLSSDGTISLNTTSFSYDGSLFAYGLSKSGSDWYTIHLKETSTGTDLPDVLEKARFSDIVWTHDNKGFFYSCYPDMDTDATGRDATGLDHQKLFYHYVGKEQKDDVKVVEFLDNPKWMIGSEVTDCGRYLIVSAHQGCRDNLIFFTDLQALGEEGIQGKLSLTQVVYKFEHDFEYITNSGTKFVFRTNRDSPNYRLVIIDIEADKPTGDTQGKPWNMTTLIAENSSEVLESAQCVDQDKLIVCYMKDVKNVLYVHDLESGKRLFELPLEIGSVCSFSGDKRYSEFFYKFTSTIVPSISYRVDMSKSPPETTVHRETEIPGFDRSQYKVEQVFYESKDGTRVPMFIASRKDAKMDGTEPCLLYGYGGFNISLTPVFADGQLFFVQHFGHFAIPNIRGGGEYGERWHNDGRLFKKQNGFNDFIGAAEYLIANKYTCRDKLAIKGGSNGGLLVGACLNQRPDLFGAGIAAVGVMDMLRFHKFTVGYAWCSDFGNPDEKDHFENIIKYSPLHTIPEPDHVQYPAVLLTTADHDDRVVPSHSLKFIAELQHRLGKCPNQTNPLMIRVETKAGHGKGKPMAKVIEESTDCFSFLVQALNYKYIE